MQKTAKLVKLCKLATNCESCNLLHDLVRQSRDCLTLKPRLSHLFFDT